MMNWIHALLTKDIKMKTVVKAKKGFPAKLTGPTKRKNKTNQGTPKKPVKCC